MPRSIKIRDVVRGGLHTLPADQRVLHAPPGLASPVGSVRCHDGLVDYVQLGILHTGRVAPGTLAETRPGDRVLVRLPPYGSEDEWWLCEVEEVDGSGS